MLHFASHHAEDAQGKATKLSLIRIRNRRRIERICICIAVKVFHSIPVVAVLEALCVAFLPHFGLRGFALRERRRFVVELGTFAIQHLRLLETDAI